MHATEKSIKKKLYGVEAFRQKGGVRVEPEEGMRGDPRGSCEAKGGCEGRARRRKITKEF